MPSVTSDNTAIASFQGARESARSKHASPNQSDGTGFSALVDSNSNAVAEHQRASGQQKPLPPRPTSSSSSHAERPTSAGRDERQSPQAANAPDAKANSADAASKSTADAISTKDDDTVSNGKSDTKDDSGNTTEEIEADATGSEPVQQDLSTAALIAIATAAITAAQPDDTSISLAAADEAAVDTTTAAAAVIVSAPAETTQDADNTPAPETIALLPVAATGNIDEKAQAAATLDGSEAAAIDDVLAQSAATAQQASKSVASVAPNPVVSVAFEPVVKSVTPRAATAEATTESKTEASAEQQEADSADRSNAAKVQTTELAANKDPSVKEVRTETVAKETTSVTSATTAAHQPTIPTAEAVPLASDAGQHTGIGTPQFQQLVSVTPTTAPLNATPTTTSAAGVPLNSLAVEISAQAQIGRNRFEIRLDPPDLGRIDVRLDVDNNGQVTSHLTVERSETLDLLRRDAPQLQRALEDAGLKTGDGGLQFSLRDQSSSGGRDDNGSARNAHRLIISEEDTVPAEIAGRSYGRLLSSRSGVDIRV